MTFWIARRFVEVRQQPGGYVPGLVSNGSFIEIDRAAPSLLAALASAADVLTDEAEGSELPS